MKIEVITNEENQSIDFRFLNKENKSFRVSTTYSQLFKGLTGNQYPEFEDDLEKMDIDSLIDVFSRNWRTNKELAIRALKIVNDNIPSKNLLSKDKFEAWTHNEKRETIEE